MANAKEDILLKAWREQSEAMRGIVEAMLHGAEKMRAIHFTAAREARRGLVSAQVAMGGAKSAAELVRVQWDWTVTSAGSATAYWKDVLEAYASAQAEILARLHEQANAAGAQAAGVAPLVRLDDAYVELVKTSQRMFDMTREAMSAAGAFAAAKPAPKKRAEARPSA